MNSPEPQEVAPLVVEVNPVFLLEWFFSGIVPKAETGKKPTMDKRIYPNCHQFKLDADVKENISMMLHDMGLTIQQDATATGESTSFHLWLNLKSGDYVYSNQDLAQLVYYIQRKFSMSYLDFLNMHKMVEFDEDDWVYDERPFIDTPLLRSGGNLERFESFKPFNTWDEIVVHFYYASEIDGSRGKPIMSNMSLCETADELENLNFEYLSFDKYLERLKMQFQDRWEES